jgi:hypothetical protein
MAQADTDQTPTDEPIWFEFPSNDPDVDAFFGDTWGDIFGDI